MGEEGFSAVRPCSRGVVQRGSLPTTPVLRLAVLCVTAAACACAVVNVFSGPGTRAPVQASLSAEDEAAQIIDSASASADADQDAFVNEVLSGNGERHGQFLRHQCVTRCDDAHVCCHFVFFQSFWSSDSAFMVPCTCTLMHMHVGPTPYSLFIHPEAKQIIRTASSVAIGKGGDTTGLTDADGKAIVSDAVSALATGASATTASSQPELNAPTPVVAADSGSQASAYHEEASRIISTAKINYKQKLEDEHEIDGAPDGLGRGRAAANYLTCYQLGGVQFDTTCCSAECGHCSGGGRDSAEPCMNRGYPLRSTAWAEDNCCSPNDFPQPQTPPLKGISADCATSDPPCKCMSKEVCRPLPAGALAGAAQAPAGVSDAADQTAAPPLGEHNVWGTQMGEGIDPDSPRAASLLKESYKNSIFGDAPLGEPAVSEPKVVAKRRDGDAQKSIAKGTETDGVGGEKEGSIRESGEAIGTGSGESETSGGEAQGVQPAKGVGHEGLAKAGAAAFSADTFKKISKGKGQVAPEDIAEEFGNGEVGEAETAAAKWWNNCFLMPEKCPHYPPSKAAGAIVPWGNTGAPPPPPASHSPDLGLPALSKPKRPTVQVKASVPGAEAADWATGKASTAHLISRPGFQRDFAITDFSDNGAKPGEGIVVDTSADYAFVGGDP